MTGKVIVHFLQFYPDSHGGDVSIPYYGSSLGYGFLWNLPSYGWVNITEDELGWFSNATLNAGGFFPGWFLNATVPSILRCGHIHRFLDYYFECPCQPKRVALC
jgi:hypothetical protein